MHNNFTVYQCKECRTIVADSSTITGKDEDVGMISFRNTPSVLSVNQKIYTSLKGKDKYCTFQTISCRKCSNILGRLYYGTTPSLDFFRNAFAFYFDSIISYEIGYTREITETHMVPQLESHDESEEENHRRELNKADQIKRDLAYATKRLAISSHPTNKENYHGTPRKNNQR